MTKQEVSLHFMAGKESTTAVTLCKYGHCYHQGTAWDLYYCCRCGDVKQPLIDTGDVVDDYTSSRIL